MCMCAYICIYVYAPITFSPVSKICVPIIQRRVRRREMGLKTEEGERRKEEERAERKEGKKEKRKKEKKCKKSWHLTLPYEAGIFSTFPLHPLQMWHQHNRLVMSHPIYAVSSFFRSTPPYMYLPEKKPEEQCCRGVEMKPVR